MEEKDQKTGKLNLTIKSASQIFFQGQVEAVSFTNKLGPFDILPGHQNMIALVDRQIAIYLDQKRKFSIPITRGVVKVGSDQVMVFVGI